MSMYLTADMYEPFHIYPKTYEIIETGKYLEEIEPGYSVRIRPILRNGMLLLNNGCKVKPNKEIKLHIFNCWDFRAIIEPGEILGELEIFQDVPCEIGIRKEG